MKPFILAALLVITLSAKDRNWEMGRVVNDELTSRYGGQTPQGFPVNRVMDTVVIAGVDSTYTAQRELEWLPKHSTLIVNTSVKFAVEKRKLFLIDANGKQFELDIIKQVKNPY